MTKITKAITPDETEALDKKLAEDFGILRRIEPIQHFVFGTSLAMLIGSAADFIFSPVLFWVGVAGVALATLLTPVSRLVRKQSKTRYDAFFAQYEFLTPAGEEVDFVSSDHTGTHIDVRFPDGHEANYPLYRLRTKAGQLHEWARFKHISWDHFEHLSKVKWRTPEGKIGIVRKVIHWAKKDIELVLKLEGGQIAGFPLGTLEPLPESSATPTKTETASS